MSSKKFVVLLGLASFATFWVAAMTAEFVNAGKAANERPLAIVRRFKPDVRVKHAETSDWIDAKMAEKLYDLDTLKTEATGYAAVQFMDNSLVKVKPNSLLIVRGEVRSKNSTSGRLAVEVGEVFLNVTKRRSEFSVQTPTSVGSVKGTSFSTNVGESGETTFLGFSGSIEVTALNSGQKVTISRRKKATVDSEGNSITVKNVSNNDLGSEERQYNSLDDQSKPKLLKLRFRNDSGQTREVEVQYYELEGDN